MASVRGAYAAGLQCAVSLPLGTGDAFEGVLELFDTGPEMERRFDFALTYDRDLVIEAASALMRRIQPLGGRKRSRPTRPLACAASRLFQPRELRCPSASSNHRTPSE